MRTTRLALPDAVSRLLVARDVARLFGVTTRTEATSASERGTADAHPATYPLRPANRPTPHR
jgi:hypothetical protein